MNLPIVLMFFFSTTVIASLSYTCLGAKYGCILSEHNATGLDFFDSLSNCELKCPQIGKMLSWQCEQNGNCRIVNHVPDASKNMFKSLTACANAPNGQCFAPGRLNISYECHGSHFGCIEKTTTADGNVTFASIDECEEKCRIVPSGYSLGCAGSRPSTCVMLRQPMSNSTDQYFNGIEACSRYCNQV